MNAIRTYGNLIKKCAPAHQKAALRLIKAGRVLEQFSSRFITTKGLPDAYKFLNHYAVNEVLQGLRHPENTVWANLFAPVELLQCFGVHVLSMECLSSFLSGFTIENYFLDFAEGEGFSPTLCSYHKNFIGAADAGILPPAAFALSTSTICDANVGTLRHLSQKHHIPSFLLDIPEQETPRTVAYVVRQLEELIARLEETFGKSMDYDELARILARENASKAAYLRILKHMKTKAYPSTLTLQMYLLFASHLSIGTPEILSFFEQMEAEVAAAEDFDGLRILWVHLVPFYQETLQSYFNNSATCQIQTMEMHLDYTEELDITNPLEALAKKMINNVYTGSFERKAALVQQLATDLDSDGVISFCHWGCKQSFGGVALLKEKMQEINMPFLVLDGDGMDRRNSHDGQIKTRFEAFLEVVRAGKGGGQ